MFAKNLKYLRQLHNIDQLQLAEALGRKSASSISEWESGKYTPKIGVLSMISSYFNVDLDDMMTKDLELENSMQSWSWSDQTNTSDTSDEQQKIIFATNLKHLIDKSEKTQKEVATAIGVSPQTLNTWLQRIALPRMGKIQLLADYFGISKTDLLDPKDPDQTNTSDTDPEAVELVRFLSDNTEYKELITSLKDVSKEDLNAVKVIVDRLKDKKD
jgi:transcriptional regulator, cro/CI family